MDLNVLKEFLNVIIVGICVCTGYIVKEAIPSNKINRFIPLIVGLLGTILAIVSNINQISLEVILTGLFSGLASTGLYEAFRNLINKKGNE